MDIGAGRHPDCLEARVFDHGAIVIVDFDAPVFVFFACPAQLGRLGAANGDNVGVLNAIEKGTDVTFAHATEAGDGNVHFDALFVGCHCVMML
jgi:hypothetical protein